MAIELGPMIDWPTGEKPEPDTRMVRCALRDYLDCAAKCPAACFCNKMPAAEYLEAARRKYGDDQS